ncbi:MAG: TlpA family protein disulfide reductase [Ferruginibacter sp.]
MILNSGIPLNKPKNQFYDRNVNQYPFAAFYLLRNINLNRYSDSFVTSKFNMLPKYAQKSEVLEDIYYRINFEKENVKIGKRIPNFIFQTENNNKTDLYGLNYKYKLLVFGASWCAPCINEIKDLDSLNIFFQKKGLGILAINVDNTVEKWKVYTSNCKTNCSQLFSGNPNSSKIYKYFNINSIPFIVLLDAKNNILKNNIQLKEIEKYIQ